MPNAASGGPTDQRVSATPPNDSRLRAEGMSIRYVQVQFKGSDDDVAKALRAVEWFVKTDTRTRFVLDGTHTEEVDHA